MSADRVILRRWPKKEGGGVIALLPDCEANRGMVQSYEHIGQHGEASRDIVYRTAPARSTDPDARELLHELRSIGYKPVIRRRLPSWRRSP